jgi:ornithine cyclodeaminase/alanine dehydrogenase-like protein (mu-crystallin family)
LFRSSTGELAALLEADFLGQMRTGAASGVATNFMARTDAHSLGMIGTGSQARTQLEAVSKVRKLDRIRVYGRDAQRRENFCREMSERLELQVDPVASAEEAVREAYIVITATNSVMPVLQGEWLAPGAHLNAMGANLAARRELDRDAVLRAAVVAVDSIEQARMESGDLLQVFGGDASAWTAVCELAEIVAGKISGRQHAQDITLFKSNGIATWDIAVAAKVLELAQAEGVGREIAIAEILD